MHDQIEAMLHRLLVANYFLNKKRLGTYIVDFFAPNILI